jgi:hypothetical protein
VFGTVQALGSVQTVGTSQVLGTVQNHGTTEVLGTVSIRPGKELGERFVGALYSAATSNGTLVPAPGAGTSVRIFDLTISGRTAGSAWIELGDGTPGPGAFTPNTGSLVFSSRRGVVTMGTSKDILFNCGAGTFIVFLNYILET